MRKEVRRRFDRVSENCELEMLHRASAGVCQLYEETRLHMLL